MRCAILKGMKKALGMILGFLLILLAGLAFISNYYYRSVTQKGPGTGEMTEFTVNVGEGAATVADRLARNKVISSPILFRIYLKLNNLDSRMQAGTFNLSDNLSISAVADILQRGFADLKVTFPEGWRREEMARYLLKKFNSAQEGLGRAGNIGEDFLAASDGLEGYLFPDTYYIPSQFNVGQVVRLLRQNFDTKIKELPKTDLSINEVVTLASIVEREAKYDEDRPIVAGILLKRLSEDWPLEVDATLQYALATQRMAKDTWLSASFNFWPEEITSVDLQLTSLYNTRKNPGLPPTPICNPGLAALRAVAKAQKTDYWFYVSDKGGHMHYARTIEEHSANISRYVAVP